jgi:hypothetical protein
VLWELGGTWEPLHDALLRSQPDQAIEAMFIEGKTELRAVSSSPQHNLYMTWRFTREPD